MSQLPFACGDWHSDARSGLDLICSWDIEKARDVAWLTANTLWHLRPLKPLFDAFAETLSSTVGMGSRLLLTPAIR
ncbi:MAG TPA: DUF5995 family protein [Mycobacterium sp.]|nr:DUF5995 family protein [Mycobacterium sp.]